MSLNLIIYTKADSESLERRCVSNTKKKKYSILFRCILEQKFATKTLQKALILVQNNIKKKIGFSKGGDMHPKCPLNPLVI